MSVKTITMTEKQIRQLEQRLSKAQKRKTPPYARYQYQTSECVITAYESGKVVFQGEGADFYAQGWETAEPDARAGRFPQAGSDEVGTGDYFGPVVVCAALVQKEDVPLLAQLQVTDSKALSDDHIRKIGPQLIERLPHSLLILNNSDYNRVHESDNMVAIKCKLHNQAYVHLRRKAQGLPDNIIIDQFVQKKSYYRYLQGQDVVITGIHFETKAEHTYPAVAAASVIARYAFLRCFDRMCERYDFHFPKGAGKQVDTAIAAFVSRHGKEALYQVGKLHFANTRKAL